MSLATTLNHRVAILAPTIGADSFGQPSTALTVLREAYANVRVLGGLETIKAGADASIVKASIRLRHCTDLTAAMRVQHGAMVYNIKSVLPDPNRRHVDLVCEAVK